MTKYATPCWTITTQTKRSVDQNGHPYFNTTICQTAKAAKKMLHSIAENLNGDIEISVKYGAMLIPEEEEND